MTAKQLRERVTMNILTVDDPEPSVVKKSIRQLLSALEDAERRFAEHAIQCPQCHEAALFAVADAPALSEQPKETP